MGKGNIQRAYATVNRNLINPVGLGGFAQKVISRDGVTKLHLYVLLDMLARVQLINLKTPKGADPKLRLDFKSRHEMLKEPGWRDTPQYYDALDKALKYWHGTEFYFSKWYNNEDGKDWRSKRRFGVRRVRRQLGGLVITFDKDFYNANSDEGNFAEIWLEDIQKAPKVQHALAVMFRKAMPYMFRKSKSWLDQLPWTGDYSHATMAAKIGVEDSNPSRRDRKVEDIFADIGRAVRDAVQAREEAEAERRKQKPPKKRKTKVSKAEDEEDEEEDGEFLRGSGRVHRDPYE